MDVARKLGGPVDVVKAQIHAGGRGKGRFKNDPNGKGGVRIAKSIEEVGQHAAAMLGHDLVTKQTGPAGKTVKRLYIEEGVRHQTRALSLDAGRPRHRPHRRHRLDRRRHGHRDGGQGPSREDRRAGDRPGGRLPALRGPQDRLRARARGQAGRRVREAPGQSLQGLHRARLLADRDQPADRHRRGRGHRARCQDELRRQRALPPQGAGGPARRRRGGSGRDRGRQVRPELRQARRQDRLHGERRGPRHGHHGHHQALWRASPPTSSMSAAAPPRSA